jgi:hypothetical protein
LDWDRDVLVDGDNSQTIKNAFVEDIEDLLPGFMDVVREMRKLPLKKVARAGVHSNESEKLARSVIEFS